jgi:hypothetical protein
VTVVILPTVSRTPGCRPAEDIAEGNIKKLADRQKRGGIGGSGTTADPSVGDLVATTLAYEGAP